MPEATSLPKWTKPTMTLIARQQVQGKIRFGSSLVEGHRPANGTPYHFADLSNRTSDIAIWDGGGASRITRSDAFGPTGPS
jgi:hypothetical protein